MKLLLLLLVLPNILLANWKLDREELENVYKVDEFRIFYSLQGKNKLKNKKDKNFNNIPDFVESIALQLQIANDVFTKQLLLVKPLDNKRYKNRAKFIDIHILKLSNKNNGQAGDAVIKYDYKILRNNYYSLSIAISNNLPFNNLTPTHELFHIYQNSYTLIKNRWYTEGTARLIEDYFKKTKQASHRVLPQTKTDLNKIFLNTYSNNYFFKRLIYLCNNNFLIDFLNNLTLQEIKIGKKYHLDKYTWKEEEQKNTRNNIYILRAIKSTILENKNCTKNKELLNFLELIK